MNLINLDYLIVGQGLAGSILALTLLEHQQKIALINDSSILAASAVAAGLFNPITGRRMNKTWLAGELFPFLENYYSLQEKKLGQRFFYPKTIYRPFVSLEEQNTWIAETAQPDVAYFTEIALHNQALHQAVHAPYGGMYIHHAGYLDVKAFLQAARTQLQRLDVYQEEPFNYSQLRVFDDHSQYGVFASKKILFCQGPHAVVNPFFGKLPFRPVKGELLHLAIDDFPAEYIINQHLFVIPLPDGTYRAGATYDWQNLNWEPSENGRNELLEKVSKLIRTPVQVLDHWAGIRPATADRRPLVGVHPEQPVIGFFGGMGSKGVSLIPYLAQHFTDFLVFQQEIMPEININRYLSLYKN